MKSPDSFEAFSGAETCIGDLCDDAIDDRSGSSGSVIFCNDSRGLWKKLLEGPDESSDNGDPGTA